MKACFALPDREALCAELAQTLKTRIVFDFSGSVMQVAATSPVLINRLRRVYRHFIAEGASRLRVTARMIVIGADSAEAEILARRLRRAGAGAAFGDRLLLADWIDWGIRIETDALLHYYASKLLRLWVVRRWDPEIATLHAASLSGPAGVGILLIGEAASGKTTLALRLLKHGFRYCADDTTCVRRDDLVCLPFPMAFVLRDAPSIAMAGPAGWRPRPPDIEFLDEARWLVERWEDVGVAFRPARLYFLTKESGLEPGRSRPLPESEAALLLLRNLVMPLGADADEVCASPDNFDFVCRLAEASGSVTLDTTDLDAALRTILADDLACGVAAPESVA
jgi:hypothetical protein